MITVKRHARRHDDRSGDPLDGLVNMFDIGIVLSLGFLLAALSSLQLSDALTRDGGVPKNQITVNPDDTVKQVPDDAKKVVGQGVQVGTVYKLDDGRLIYVVPPGTAASPGAGPTASPTSRP